MGDKPVLKKVGSAEDASGGRQDRLSSTASMLAMQLKKNASAVGLRLSRKAADNLLFCRYELKYRINESKAAAIIKYIQPYLHPDRYANARPDGFYPVSSLYLDSDSLQLCREAQQGKKNRFKLRIRIYGDNPSDPCFFEIKRRINNVIVKSRARTSKQHIAAIITKGTLPGAGDCSDIKSLRQFMLYVDFLNTRPRMLVRYLRRAYEGDKENMVRITFDRELCYKATGKPVVEINGPGWQRIPLGFIILEIKFTTRYPAWLSEMVKTFDLRQSAVSKYVCSITQSITEGRFMA